MKKWIVLSCILLIIFEVEAQQTDCRVKVSVKNYPGQEMILWWDSAGIFKEQRIALHQGKGELLISATLASSGTLISMDSTHYVETPMGKCPIEGVSFFVERGKIELNVDHNQWPFADIKGGPLNQDWMNYQKNIRKQIIHFFHCQQQMANEEDSVAIAQFSEEVGHLNREIEQQKRIFIHNNPHSYIALYLLSTPMTLSEKEKENLFMKLDTTLHATELGHKFLKEIEGYRKTMEGEKAPLFQKKDMNGKLISLTDYRGKYVLLDFWGSWCHPCRRSHVHLRELHQKYSPLGLEFINIGQEVGDEAREIWIKAVKEDRLTWTQILNTEDKASGDLVELYGLQCFPTKILIDPSGIIVGRYLGEFCPELDEKLKEIFTQ